MKSTATIKLKFKKNMVLFQVKHNEIVIILKEDSRSENVRKV